MAIYQNRRELDEIEVDALLSACPTLDADGVRDAAHADLVAEADFDLRPNEVRAAIEASPKLVAAGISVANDAIAPRWCIVTMPADRETGGIWATTYEYLAKTFVESHDAQYIEKVMSDITIDEETGDVTINSKSGVWRLRDRYDRWLGVTGYIAQIEAKL